MYEPGTLTVEKAPLTGQVGKLKRKYGASNPSFSTVKNTVTYNGLVNDDTAPVFTTNPKVSTSATTTSDVGTYPITLEGGEATNYIVNYEPGTLTVEKAPQSITWSQNLSKEFVIGEEVTLSARASSGLTVSYTTSDETIAVVEQNGSRARLRCLEEGEVVITATQEGDRNRLAATPVSKTIRVKASTGFSSTSIEGLAIYPNPATTHMNIQAEGGIKRVLLHSLAGTLLMDEDGHDEATHRLDLTRLPQGTYLLTVETSAGVCTERIVKE